MGRFGVVAMLVAAGMLVLVGGLLLAQTGGTPGQGGRAGTGGAAGPPDSSARDLERLGAMLTDARLIGAERTAAEAAVTKKLEARRDLITALGDLRAATEDTKVTDEGLKQAVGTYEKALAKYRGVVETQDKALVAKLSVRSQARCLAVGILDNGIGMMGRRSRPGGTEGGGGGGRRGPEAAP